VRAGLPTSRSFGWDTIGQPLPRMPGQVGQGWIVSRLSRLSRLPLTPGLASVLASGSVHADATRLCQPVRLSSWTLPQNGRKSPKWHAGRKSPKPRLKEFPTRISPDWGGRLWGGLLGWSATTMARPTMAPHRPGVPDAGVVTAADQSAAVRWTDDHPSGGTADMAKRMAQATPAGVLGNRRTS
jgi:hypothetical protein